LSPTDGCEGTFRCTTGTIIVTTCDGENDGSGTSLCACVADGEPIPIEDLTPGEAPDSCYASLGRCFAALYAR
jgi:hypothetical protein